MIKVIFEYDPEDDERDDRDLTGLTEKAFEKLHRGLTALGAEDIDIRRVVPRG